MFKGNSPIEDQFKDIVVWTMEATEAQKQYNKTIESFSYAFGEAMANALQSQDNFFKSFLENLKQAIIKQLIMPATANFINKALGGKSEESGGIFNMIKGALGVGIGNVTSGGGNIPSSVARMGNPNQSIEVFGRLTGDDIFLSNQGAGGSRARGVEWHMVRDFMEAVSLIEDGLI